MPAPTILGWCTNSLTSLQRSVHHMLTGYTKPEVEEDPPSSLPFPSTINQLRGKTPGEKLKYLNDLIRNLPEREFSCSEENNFSPLVRTTAAKEFHMHDLVLEGLHSSDSKVVRCALKADWFFYGESEYVNFRQFKDLLTAVSLKTRRSIIKKLSWTLVGFELKAQEFFDGVLDLYSLEESLPFLNACSEDFIYEKILKYKINLSVKMLDSLFKRVPKLVVKYLQLGNKHNDMNSTDRNQHQIKINDYDSFLPKLIKKYPRDFVQLYEITPEKEFKFGDVKSAMFMKNLKRDVIEKPRIFLKLLSLNVVCENLKRDQMVKLIENMFPNDINDFNLDEILDILEHYHQGSKFMLLKDTYSFYYDKFILDEDILMRSKRLQKIIPIYDRKPKSRFLARKYEMINPDLFLIYVSYLPPNESIPILIQKASSSISAEERTRIFGYALTSCSVYKSKQDLIEVMNMFMKNFKEDSKSVILHNFFAYLTEDFDLAELEDPHWTVIQDIILLAHVKKELLVSHITLIENILEATLHNLLAKQKNSELVDKMFDILVETKIIESSPSWNIIKSKPELEYECLERFLQMIPSSYPDSHEIWNDKNKKLSLAFYITKAMISFNDRNSKSKKSSRKPQNMSIKIQNYPWVLSLANEFFGRNETGYRKKKLMCNLKKLCPEIYEAKLDQYMPIRDIESGEALFLLRKNYEKVLINWFEYLEEARQKLVAGSREARRFVFAVRWYTEISDKFVKHCLHQLEDDGSILVLGILLEGESFEEVIAPLVPNELTFDPERKDAKKHFERTRIILRAMKYVNPPVSFDLVAVFCNNDYARLSDGMMANLVRNVPTEKVMKFAKNLSNNRSTTVRKQAARMIQSIGTRTQIHEFLGEIWNIDKNPCVRLVVGKMIFNNFVKDPTEKNWNLTKACINGLTVHDRKILEKFSEIEYIDLSYVSLYIEEYLNKIDVLSVNNQLDTALRTKCVCLMIEAIDSKIMEQLTEKTNLNILRSYFLDADSIEISQVVQNFTVRSYLLQAGDKLKKRLEEVVKILTSIMENFDRPYPAKPRSHAANYTIHEFFRNALTEISRSNSDKKIEIIEGMLDVFKANLAPWQESWSYIALNIYKEYLMSQTPKDFGTRCANRTPTLIEEFSANDSVVDDVAACIEDFMNNKIFRDIKNPELKLKIIHGILNGDDHYGALLAIKLLNHNEIETYDDSYEYFIKVLRNQKSEIFLYHYYNHINRIKYCTDS